MCNYINKPYLFYMHSLHITLLEPQLAILSSVDETILVVTTAKKKTGVADFDD